MHHAFNANADGTFTEPAGRGFGFTDGITEFAGGDQHRLNDSNFGSRFTPGKVVTISDGVGTALAEAALSSFDADGLTLNWTTVDAATRNFGWLAIGPAGSGGGGSPIILPNSGHFDGICRGINRGMH